jgi:hypothetical protein
MRDSRVSESQPIIPITAAIAKVHELRMRPAIVPSDTIRPTSANPRRGSNNQNPDARPIAIRSTEIDPQSVNAVS